MSIGTEATILPLTVEELWNVPSSCADDHYPDDFSLCGIPDFLALENRALISPVLMVFRLRSLSPTVFRRRSDSSVLWSESHQLASSAEHDIEAISSRIREAGRPVALRGRRRITRAT